MAEDELEPVDLEISVQKVCYIIVKAREFDVKTEPVEPDPGSDPPDDGEREVIEDYGDDATEAELSDAIAGLNEDEIIDLIALAWVGRGDFERAEWQNARALAEERHGRDPAAYLLGLPTLGDFLEEGLAALGYSCLDYEAGRL